MTSLSLHFKIRVCANFYGHTIFFFFFFFFFAASENVFCTPQLGRRTALFLFLGWANQRLESYDFSCFVLQVTLIFPTNFREKKFYIYFKIVVMTAILNISNRNDFNYLFFIYKSPRYFIPSFESVGFLVQEEFKTDFQDGGHGDNLGFPIGTILAIFNLLIVPVPKQSFKSIYSTGWEELLKM